MIRRALAFVMALALPVACSGPGSDNPQATRADAAAVCGSNQIRGERLGRIRHQVQGCGIADAVSVVEVSGVALSRPATLDCKAARSLNKWVRGSVKPAFARTGGGVERLQVWDTYNCRTRNSRRGAKISTHGRGLAVDVGAFVMQDGTRVDVLGGWNDRRHGPTLKKLHRRACGTFTTVLGPNHDRAHANHFHLDREQHGYGGTFCR